MEPLLKLQKECPGLHELLGKFFSPADLAVIAGDYARCSSAGANAEEGFQREEGVSFRPRIARVVTILAKEAGLRDVTTLRAAVIACAAARGISIEYEDQRLVETVSRAVAARGGAQPSSAGFAIALALELDTIRHLHMTSFPPDHKERRLSEAGLLSGLTVPDESDAVAALRVKLAHAIALQQRSLKLPPGGGQR